MYEGAEGTTSTGYCKFHLDAGQDRARWKNVTITRRIPANQRG